MTTAEATISMVNRLSEREQLDVQAYIERIFASRKRTQRKTVALRQYTEEEFLQLIDQSIEQSKNGEVYSWEEVQKATHEKYGF